MQCVRMQDMYIRTHDKENGAKSVVTLSVQKGKLSSCICCAGYVRVLFASTAAQ